VLKKVLSLKTEEITREWRRVHNEDLYDQHSSPNNIHMIKSRRTGWAGHMAHMGDKRGAYRVLMRKPQGQRPQLGIDGRIILKWFFKNLS
jgi:hypothetical protein